ncbi:protein YgfX [Neptuniibacter halophilus]|uniref:protein YgfX n=1 Tax=Neptuniibacter halophilus TaxID=651666 RepID=UPI0025746959|nr:protein YgfX [Neptuniibacter halophilus]
MFSLSNLQLRPSKGLFCTGLALHFIALLAVIYWPVDAALKWTLAPLLLLISFFCFRHQVLQRSAFSIVALSWDADTAQLKLRQNNGQWLRVEALRQIRVLPFLLALQCRVPERLFTVSVIVCRDSCGAAEFRRLRVLLLHARAKL